MKWRDSGIARFHDVMEWKDSWQSQVPWRNQVHIALMGIIRGVQLFSFGARLRTAGAPRSEAEGFTETRSAERGRVGEGSPPPAGGGLVKRRVYGALFRALETRPLSVHR